MHDGTPVGRHGPDGDTLECAPRFDWYAATVYDEPLEVETAIAGCFDAAVRGGAPMHGYEQAREFVLEDGTVAARLLFGGANGHPHAWASGEHTEAFATMVRALWPDDHHVTRFDSALDFLDEGHWWRDVYRIATDLAERRRLKTTTAGDWVRPRALSEDGRTLYVGSMKSPIMVRLYEKGKQLRASGLPADLERHDRDWLRLEVQVRPQKAARRRAAGATPEEAWGFSAWTGALYQAVKGAGVKVTPMHEHRDADLERSLSWMLEQYRKVLSTLRLEVGSWEALGAELGRRLEPAAQLEDRAPITDRGDEDRERWRRHWGDDSSPRPF